MMRKVLTSPTKEEIYYWLNCYELFLKEQKGCCDRTTGTDLLYIDQHILKEAKTRWINLVMTWIDYKKSNYIILLTLLIEFLKVYKISDKVMNVNTKDKKN